MKRFSNWYRGAAAVIVLFAASFMASAQCTPSQQSFDTAYWAAQPPAVVALSTQATATAAANAATVAAQGYIVDVPIDVYHWDACLVMASRAQYGYTWVPSAVQPPLQVAPGLTYNGLTYNPATPPPGSIIVSTLASSYPPFIAPKPPAPAPSAICPPPGPPSNGCVDPVGPLSVGIIYLTVAGDTSPNGTVFSDTRGTFSKSVFVTPFGNESFWTLTVAGGSQ